MFENCLPNLIFISFSSIQIIVDLYKGLRYNAFIKFIIMIIISLVINILCEAGLQIVAWFFVFIPVVLMTIVSMLLLTVFGDDKDIRKKLIYHDNLDRPLNRTNNEHDLIIQRKEVNKNKQRRHKKQRDKKIDRDYQRKKLYDEIEEKFDLNSHDDNKYDLTNNPIKYNLVDNYINFDKYFDSNYMLYNFNRNNIFTSNIINYKIPFLNINDLNDLTKSVRTIKPIKQNDLSYKTKYNSTYLLDGKLLYTDFMYNKLKKDNPNREDNDINDEISNLWNELSESERTKWDEKAS